MVIKNFTVLTAMLLSLFISGCATTYDVGLFDSYTNAELEYAKTQGDTMKSMASSIASLSISVDSSADPRDKAMATMQNIMLSMAISDLKYTPSSIKAPTLNTDNVGIVGDVITSGIPILGMVKVSEVAAENFTGTTTLTTANGDVSVTDSLNRTEVHSVALDGSTASTTSTQDRTSSVVNTEDSGEDNK